MRSGAEPAPASSGQLWLVGPSLMEQGADMQVLRAALSEAGLRWEDVRYVQPHELAVELRRSRPRALCTLGADAATAALGSVGSVERLRGYTFERAGLPPTLLSIEPALVRSQWVPWRLLLATDLKRARELAEGGLHRPARAVEVVSSPAQAERAVQALMQAPRLACDIEIYDANTLQCVGFASSPAHAAVFPARYIAHARELLLHHPSLCFQNGQFDLHFLLTRCETRVAGFADDTLIAWHCAYPELAGTSYSASGARRLKRTHKSLAFLASIFCWDEWWKDYEGATDHEMYVLNGRDCCITFEIMQELDVLLDSQAVHEIYQHELSLVWPCVEMQSRGVRINEQLRQQRIVAISEQIALADTRLDELALPLIASKLSELSPAVRKLFEHRKRCGCCGGGAKARGACWRCAGFGKAPGKRELAASGLELAPCAVCAGEGELRTLVFNGRSAPQKQALLYEVLRLPRRYKTIRVKGRASRQVLSTDEDTLRSLLAGI